jgi:tetratricopeptide (TPR) repeat protein
MVRNSAQLMVVGLGLTLLLSACGGAESRKAKHMERGRAYLAAANYEKARVEFQNVLQIAPKDAEARFELGVVAEKLNNPRQALQFYQGALDVDPERLDARADLARIFLFAGAPDRALELVEPALVKHPDDAELLTVRAAAREQKKDMQGALADGQRAVELNPSNEDAVAVLAGLYSTAGQTQQAQTLLEKAVQSLPKSVDLRLILAQIYIQQSQAGLAETQLRKLIELKPEDPANRLRLAQYFAQVSRIDDAEATLRQAVKELPAERSLKTALVDFLAARRSREVAESELKGMISAAPADFEMRFALAKFYRDGAEWDKAQGVYQQVIDDQGTKPPGLVARDRLAALRVERNDLDGALLLVNAVLAKSPRDDDALNIRGNIALVRSDPRAAIEDLRAVLRDQPNAVGVLRSLARAHLANGEPAVAEETLRHALEGNPDNTDLELDFAQLLAQTGKPERSKPLLADLLRRQPDNFAALDTQFRVSMALKDYGLAKSSADALVAARPKGASGYLYQGLVAEAEKRPQDALHAYASAFELQPDSLEALQGQLRVLIAGKHTSEAMALVNDVSQRYASNPLGPEAKAELLMAQGNNPDAQRAYQDAIARAPKWWPPYRGLAVAQRAAGQTDAALATLRQAQTLVIDPDPVSFELAAALESAGRYDESIGEYEKLLKRNPRSELAANNLAMTLANYKRDSTSMQRAKDLSARFADSSNPAFLDTYGWVLYKRGEAAPAVLVLQKVVDKLPNEPLARFHLGMAQSLAGSTLQARDNLARAVSSGTKFAGWDEAKSTLDKLSARPAPSI